MEKQLCSSLRVRRLLYEGAAVHGPVNDAPPPSAVIEPIEPVFGAKLHMHRFKINAKAASRRG